MPGRLLSSQGFSIGRSISLTRSSSVLGVLHQHGLGERVECAVDRRRGRRRDQIARSGIGGAGSGVFGQRGRPAVGSGSAHRRTRRPGVAVDGAESPASVQVEPSASVSSAVVPARGFGSCAAVAAVASSSGEHGVDFVLAIGGRGAATAGLGAAAERQAWRAPLAAVPARPRPVAAARRGLPAPWRACASSSAMIRRMEARISSIEGSCAFAAWVIRLTFPHTPRVPRRRKQATRRANCCRIPFIRQRCAGMADGTTRNAMNCGQRRPACSQCGSEIASAAVRRAHADPAVAHLLVVHARHRRLGARRPSTCGESRPTAASSVYEATTRSRCAVTSATRALTSSCCALSTSSVVRWPTRASSRTPLSAISAPAPAPASPDIGLGRLELAPGLHDGLAHLVARGVEIEPALAERLLGLADQRIFRAALVDRHGRAGRAPSALKLLSRRQAARR